MPCGIESSAFKEKRKKTLKQNIIDNIEGGAVLYSIKKTVFNAHIKDLMY
jgi:hypothetical protein